MDCGPSNAVKNLNNFNNQDHSLQRQHPTQQQNGNLGFRNNAVNNQSFNEFANFKPEFTPEFSAPQYQMGVQGPTLQGQNLQQRNGIQGQGTGERSWVNDFSNLSLRNQNGVQQSQMRQVGQVGQMNQMNQMSNQMNQGMNQMQMGQPGQMGQYQPRFQMNMNQGMTQMNQGMNQMYPQQNLTEHKELHAEEMNNHLTNQDFENEFKMIENETVQPQQTDADREDFAKTAGKIHDHLIQHDKFKNSKFVELMNGISQRQVEISDDGENFVNTESSTQTSQTNIESHQGPIMSPPPNPVLPVRVDPMNPILERGSVPLSQQSSEVQDIVNKLPDPLSHIREGDLQGISDPLLAARIISGNQIKTTDWIEDFDQQKWQEFDDYRHDDDLR